MKILIFGASGFIGSHLARHFASLGHIVVCFCRKAIVQGIEGECHPWSLGDQLNDLAIKDADCALHLAHDFDGTKGAEKTLMGTIDSVLKLRQTGVGRQIVFSSYSAGPHASSLYGRTKSALEKRLHSVDGVIIVRPGLVLGNGGLYGRISKFVRLSPWIPLPDGGSGKVPVIEIGKLCRLIHMIMTATASQQEYNLFERELLSLREIVEYAAREAGRRAWVIPVPSSLVLHCLRFASVMQIPLPVNADNLAGFLANQEAYHVSCLDAGKHLEVITPNFTRDLGVNSGP